MVINSTDINKTYKNFKRSLRRNINDCLKKGIMVFEGNSDDKQEFLNLVDKKERAKAIIEGEGLPAKWKPDKVVEEAMDFYSKFKPTSALLLEDTRYAVDKVRKMLRDIDLTEVDEKGRPIYTIDKVLAAVKLVPPLVKDLDEAERALSAEMRQIGKMRGQGEKTIMEDTLDI
jgi:uncharacterized protein YoxC